MQGRELPPPSALALRRALKLGPSLMSSLKLQQKQMLQYYKKLRRGCRGASSLAFRQLHLAQSHNCLCKACHCVLTATHADKQLHLAVSTTMCARPSAFFGSAQWPAAQEQLHETKFELLLDKEGFAASSRFAEQHSCCRSHATVDVRASWCQFCKSKLLRLLQAQRPSSSVPQCSTTQRPRSRQHSGSLALGKAVRRRACLLCC